jgi:hypothetical protein
MPEDLLSQWDGINDPGAGKQVQARSRWNPEGPATDYDRACDVRGYLGLLAVGEGIALVLGEEPLPATWRPQAPDAGLIIRWIFAESGEEVARALEELRPEDFPEPEMYLELDGDRLILFDSASPGNEVEATDSLRLNLLRGNYGISTLMFEPNPDTTLLLHKLQRL